MDIEKLFGFLGKENTATPEKVLSEIEKAKSSAPDESEFTQLTEPASIESSRGEVEFLEEDFESKLQYDESSQESYGEEKDEIDEALSIFDKPIPTYEEIKNLTIPDVILESQKQTVIPEEVVSGEVQEEVVPSFQPEGFEEKEVYAESSDISELLKDFKVGEVEEEKVEEVSASELEGLLGVGEEKEQPEKGLEEFFTPTTYGEEAPIFPEEKAEVGEELFGTEGEKFSFGEEIPSEGETLREEEYGGEKVEEIIKGMGEAEEVQFTGELEEFSEEPEIFTVSEEEPVSEEFEKVAEVKPEERVYEKELPPEEKYAPTYEEVPKRRETEVISDSDIMRAISLLKGYPTDIRRAVKDLIEKQIISETQVNELFKKILTKPSDEELKDYIKSIAPFYRFEGGRRVIIAAKKSKAEEALEKVLKRSVIVFAIGGILAIVGFFVFNIVSRNIYSENLYNKGLNLIDNGYYEEAENLFKRAEEVGGRKKEWYTKYALRYIYNNVPERAVNKLENGLKIWPYDYRLSMDYIDALTKLPEPDFQKALKYSEEFRRREDNSFRGIDLNAQVYIRMGDYYKSKNYYKQAEILYMKYLKSKDNKHIPSLFRLISVYIRMDNKDKVDEIYDYIKRLDEKAVSEPVGIELSRYYIDKNDLERAKKVLFELSTIKPKDPEFYYEFSRYLFRNQNYREAEKNLKITLYLNPKHAKSYILMGDIDYLLRRKDSAIENYKKGIEIDPSLKEGYFKLGDALYEKRDYATALGYYLEGLKLGTPEDSNYLASISYNIANIYYKNNMLNESLKYLSYSYIRSPENPVLSHFIGNIYLELGKPDMALVQYNKSIEGFQKIMEKMKVINPKIIRHRELVALLIRSYNNLGVSYIMLRRDDSIKNAMLNWWEAKNYAEKINSVYPNAEYNLKLVLHPTMIRYKNFSIDKEIPDSIPDYVYTYLKD